MKALSLPHLRRSPHVRSRFDPLVSTCWRAATHDLPRTHHLSRNFFGGASICNRSTTAATQRDVAVAARPSTRLLSTTTTSPPATNPNNHADADASLSSNTSSKTSGLSVSLFKNPIVHQLWTARQQAKQDLLRARGSQSQATKIASTPADSRVEVQYAFSSDPLLWDAYKNPWGQIRLGRLLEDLDALAGNIAFFHCHTAEQQQKTNNEADYPVIVTASVDRIQLQPNQRPAHEGTDQTLSGQVTWTGTSSMEIRMRCTSNSNSTGSIAGSGTDQACWLEAYVTFVTLDPYTKKPMKIPAIVPTTDEEWRAFHAGAARARAKKQRRQRQSPTSEPSNDHVSPTAIEAHARQLLDRAGPLLTMPSLADPHSMLLPHTAVQNALLAQPQTQNLHQRVFGGFLVRRAYELAFANAYLFAGSRPICWEVDEVSFASPVDVGDLLVFHSRVLYTEPDNINTTTTWLHVEVEAWVTVPEHVSARMSNQFYFTFAVHNNNNNRIVRTVVPSNLEEARRMATRMAVDQEQARQDEVVPPIQQS